MTAAEFYWRYPEGADYVIVPATADKHGEEVRWLRSQHSQGAASVGATTYEATYDGEEGAEYTTDDSGTSSRFIETFALEEKPTTSAVPEPATWAMIIGCLGLVGGVMRRPHRKSEADLTRRAWSLTAA